MFWYCFLDICLKSNEPLTMCGIKNEAGSIIQCKISDIRLVWKLGQATIPLPSINISSCILIYSLCFISIILFVSFDLCNLMGMQKFDIFMSMFS